MKLPKPLILGAIMALTAATACQAGTLKVMVSMQKNPTLDRIIKEYQKDHESTKVELIYMKWQDQAEAISKKPDIYFGYDGFISENVDIGIIQDIGKLITPRELRDMIPNLLNAYRKGKQLYALPVAASTTMINYNKGAFKKAGLNAPKAGWTWEGDFYTACRKLSTNPSGNGVGATYGVVGLPYTQFDPVFYSYGGQYTDTAMKKVLYTGKDGMKAIDFIIRLHKEKLAEAVDWQTINNQDPKSYPFVNGKSAMQLTYGSSLNPTPWVKWLKDQKVAMDVGMSVMPSGPKGCIPGTYSSALALMVTCKNKPEAVSLMKYIISPKGQNMLYDVTQGLPTTVPGLSYPKFKKAVAPPFINAYRKSRPGSIFKTWQKLQGSLWRDVRNIVNGDATMADLLANAKQHQEEIDSDSF